TRSVSFAIASICARSSMNISTLIELSLSGRLSVSVASPSLSSRRTRPAMFLPPFDAMCRDVSRDVSIDSLLQWKIGHAIGFIGALVGKARITNAREASEAVPAPYFASDQGDFILYHGDALAVLPQVFPGSSDVSADLIFADPPYFLSNGGVTCQSGKMVSVNKGGWDRLESVEAMHAFNRAWLKTCQSVLKANGVIWVSGTRHVIFSVGFAMQEL